MSKVVNIEFVDLSTVALAVSVRDSHKKEQKVRNLVGVKYGKYQIEELLGAGGFSVVYRARDLSTQDIVAIKLLLKEWLKDSTITSMFIKEGELALKLNHPNLVKVLAIEKLYGHPYYVMEYFPGTTLDKYLHLYSPTASSVYNILMQIATALDYLHEIKLVHRDVKPNNIWVTENETAKLLDLGLSRSLLISDLSNRDRAGTPRYMSPEQKEGKKVGPKSDIFSFALVAREAIQHISSEALSDERIKLILQDALSEDLNIRPAKASQLIKELFISVVLKENKNE